MKRPGFTLIETVVVLAILGILMLASYPSILNTMEVRALDNAARDILSALQQAKWQAVSGKLNHRLIFSNSSGRWNYRIESENPPGTWTAEAGTTVKTVPTKFAVTLTLPSGNAIVFTPTGFVSGFNNSLSQVVLTSAKLQSLSQPNRWTIRYFASGSFQMLKDTGS